MKQILIEQNTRQPNFFNEHLSLIFLNTHNCFQNFAKSLKITTYNKYKKNNFQRLHEIPQKGVCIEKKEINHVRLQKKKLISGVFVHKIFSTDLLITSVKQK